MRLSRRQAIFIAAFLFLSGCATPEPVPLTASSSGYGVAKDERKLIRQGNEMEEDLRKKGLVLQDPALQRYVDGVGARLIPPGMPRDIRFHFLIVREPTINAFSLSQGAICVHTGLLVRLDNEAQLALVLAHEIAHVVQRHHLKHVRRARRKIVAAKLTQLSIAGIGSELIGLPYAASITGYGRETEQEADLGGLKLVAAAGYDVRDVPGLFARMNEMEEPGAIESFFYSDHPSNDARSLYTRRLIESGAVPVTAGGVVNAEAYRSAIAGLTVENIRLRLADGHYQFALQEAESALMRTPKDPMLHYLAGEAHRSKAQDPKGAAREEAIRKRGRTAPMLLQRHRASVSVEIARAKEAYLRALAADEGFALAHRGLGLVAYLRGEKDATRRELGLYLARGGNVDDRRYIRRLIKETRR